MSGYAPTPAEMVRAFTDHGVRHRLNEELPPAGVRGSEASGLVWVEYGRLRTAFTARVRAAFNELRRIAPGA